jgi:exosome complex RNA-binding protein Rrp4
LEYLNNYLNNIRNIPALHFTPDAGKRKLLFEVLNKHGIEVVVGINGRVFLLDNITKVEIYDFCNAFSR